MSLAAKSPFCPASRRFHSADIALTRRKKYASAKTSIILFSRKGRFLRLLRGIAIYIVFSYVQTAACGTLLNVHSDHHTTPRRTPRLNKRLPKHIFVYIRQAPITFPPSPFSASASSRSTSRSGSGNFYFSLMHRDFYCSCAS